MKSSQKGLLLWVFIFVGVFFVFEFYNKQKKTDIPKFEYAQFIEALDKKELKKVVFHTDSQLISGEIKEKYREKYNKAYKFQFSAPIDAEMRQLVEAKGVLPSFVKDNSIFGTLFLSWLPLILVVAMFFFIFRQIQAGGGKAMSFGKSRAKLLTPNKKKITFADVAGVEEAKQDLEEIVDFLKDSKKFTRLGGRIPKGVLLVGEPGTGKTLLARAVAGEAKVPFFSISGSDFVEMFVGVGASRVRDLFEQGKKNAPCLIFIDEIDAVGRHRGSGMGGGHDEREQTLNQLLVEMDGFEGTEGVILIAATNRADVLDPALLRPGRFDRRVMVGKPDVLGRKAILDVHTKKTPLSKLVDKAKIAKGTPGFSGADLENLVNEAALLAARKNKKIIEMSDFEGARDKVLMGSERKSMLISKEDKKITAYHEAGHTLVGKILPGMDPIHKVSIIPRGMALGVTQTLPDEESFNLTVSKAKNTIAFMFGGRAAEELIFKDFTTGAGNDIERATELARKMVCEWGMSEKIGPLTLEKSSGPVFLGMQRANASSEYSQAKAEEVDGEIKKLILEGHSTAVKILKEKNQALHAIAGALLEYETIDGEEVDMLVKGSSLDDLKKRRDLNEKVLKEEQKQAAQQEEDDKNKKKDKDVAEGSVGVPDPITV